ncbi:MAG: aspartate aminotransferase family protein [Candidatus Acidiferrales bacterium]
MCDARSRSTFRDSALLRRSFRRDVPVAVRGRGVCLWDSNEKQYLDFSGSAAVNFIGHGISEVAAAMATQAADLEFVHSSQLTTQVAEVYARELLEFAGENFRGGRVFFTSGGSESIETALKLSRQYQVEIGQRKRDQILGRKQSYHGSTLGALAVSGNRRRREIYVPMVREFPHVSTPYCYRCAYNCVDCGAAYAAEVEKAIEVSRGELAAFVFEPVSGATLGAAVPPKGYLEKVARVCRDSGVLLIADEVMTGMGRTGADFAIKHWGIAPDILVAAKGLSSGYAPLGAVIATEQVVNAIIGGSGTFLHGFTYNAHPVSLVAGQAVLRYLKAKRLVEAASSSNREAAGGTLEAALASLLDLNVVGDVRGLGLLWGVEFVRDRLSKTPFPAELNFSAAISQAAAQRGVLVYPIQGCVDGVLGDHILLAPPAIISKDEISWAVEQLRQAIAAVAVEH